MSKKPPNKAMYGFLPFGHVDFFSPPTGVNDSALVSDENVEFRPPSVERFEFFTEGVLDTGDN